MTEYNNRYISKVTKAFSLPTLTRPVDLDRLARKWGVTSIEKRPIASDAMLVPGPQGYKIVLRELNDPAALSRQRFSFAHELGHILLQRCGFPKQSNLAAKHRGSHDHNGEELLCDKIAAEILMPRLSYIEDGRKEGWSLKSLQTLSKIYQASRPATAIRMIDLMPETCVLAVWKPPTNDGDIPKLKWSYTGDTHYGVPRAVPRRRLWLVARALKAQDIQEGIAPVVDHARKTAEPPDVPAEALAWSQGEYRQVMVFYYPERELTDDMLAISRATR